MNNVPERVLYRAVITLDFEDGVEPESNIARGLTADEARVTAEEILKEAIRDALPPRAEGFPEAQIQAQVFVQYLP